MTNRTARLPVLGAALAATVLAGLAQPVLAQPVPPPGTVIDAEGRVYGDTPYDPRPEWKGPPPVQQLPAQPVGYDQPLQQGPGTDQAAWLRAREDWLAECRRTHKGSKGTVTGAVVGGVVGGVIGNRVAGEGDRTVGTIAGAAVGAVAGGAIGSRADSNRARDWCETYLDRYTAQAPGYGPQGYAAYGYTYQPVMVMVPVMVAAAPAPKRKCVETTVVEEWVEVTPARPHKRHIPDKRVKIVPDKRVRAD
ncbi:glycine zipper 2TM domain-containing protein [Novosphingobium sp.]|uniref:glycine zipper 2TM domain-containing protein n=1 Tax=Novosphingobium sp. TaxID=1874826 RepID=UPI0035B193CF